MRKLSILMLFLGLFQLSCSSNDSSGTNMPTDDESQENLFFKDDFDTFDTRTWTKESHSAGWVNNELQIYDAGHVSVGKDGDKSVLILTAERKGNKIYSGRVNSKGKKSFKRGTIVASIRLPKTANGLWPAFWLMGDNTKEWPACGEIDIMEMGEKTGIAKGTSETLVNSAIHYGPDVKGHEQDYEMKNVAKSLQDGKYHTYSLDWTENSLKISVDDVTFHTFDISAASGRSSYFNDKFFMLFNLAVGGDFTAITDMNMITALKDGEKACMYVDWVKIMY